MVQPSMGCQSLSGARRACPQGSNSAQGGCPNLSRVPLVECKELEPVQGENGVLMERWWWWWLRAGFRVWASWGKCPCIGVTWWGYQSPRRVEESRPMGAQTGIGFESLSRMKGNPHWRDIKKFLSLFMIFLKVCYFLKCVLTHQIFFLILQLLTWEETTYKIYLKSYLMYYMSTDAGIIILNHTTPIPFNCILLS